MHGLLAAAIAVVAICAGKVAAVNYAIGHSPQVRRAASDLPQVRQMMDTVLSQEVYEHVKQNAKAFAKLGGKSDFPAFMIERGFSEADKPEDVTARELADFEAEALPILQRFNAQNLSYEQWKAQEFALIMNKAPSCVSFADMLKGSIGVFDVLFFLLAIGAAYRIPAGQGIMGD